MRRFWAAWPAAALALFLPRAAEAHNAIAGAGDFANGVLHPLTVPAHALVLVGLGLWLGQRDPRDIRLGLLLFPVLLALGLAVSGMIPPSSAHGPILLALAACAGALVALARPAPHFVNAALAGLAALAIGLDSPAEVEGWRALAERLAGTWVGAHLAVLFVAGLTTLAQKPWQMVGVRVFGSWTAACALLVLALQLRS
jgi:urease accessory protein